MLRAAMKYFNAILIKRILIIQLSKNISKLRDKIK